MKRWIRASREHPCPICGPTHRRQSWCLIAVDGTAVICPRVESDRPVGTKGAGWLHRLTNPLPPAPPPKREPPAVPPAEFGRLAEQYAAAVGPDRLRLFAKSLGVSPVVLRRLCVGHDGEAWTFPMRDAAGRVTGIRRRLTDGRKLSVRGGHEGLFYDPDGLAPQDEILLPEGPTDTAALMMLGFAVVGRPSCLGGRELVKQLVGRRDCVVVSDADEPGLRGARQLAAELKRPGRIVRLIQPAKGKDVREWIQMGATRLVLEAVIRSAAVV